MSKLAKFEKAMHVMFCDVYNHHTQMKEIQKTGVPQEAEALAAEMVDEAIARMHSVKDVMVFITAVEMVKAYISNASVFSLGLHLHTKILPALEEVFAGEIWLRERCNQKMMNLMSAFFTIKETFENGEQ